VEILLELHGDRGFKDDKAMIGGLGKIGGQVFMIVGQQKDITRRPSIQKLRDGKSEGYRNAALDENGREVWYSCSDLIDTQVLIQGWKRKNADKVSYRQKYI
jgi:acetyl-CoA carboxylase alpha subunit